MCSYKETLKTYHNIGAHWIREGDIFELDIALKLFRDQARLLLVDAGDLKYRGRSDFNIERVVCNKAL